MRVDQVLPSLASRDAIGVHTVNLRDALRVAGIESDIYYGSHTPDVEHEGRPVIDLGRAARDRWLLYQASIGSPVFDIVAARSEPKLVYYHNITPGELLRDWEPDVAYETSLGRSQLARLAPQSRFAMSASAFNDAELRALGYQGTAVARLLIDVQAKSDRPDPVLARSLARRKARDGGADLLYVGKISPHKAPHDLVKMLDVLRRTADPRARLHLVGSPLSEKYERALVAFIEELGLSEVALLPGSVTGAELEAYYEAADVFVTASDHEGFCVPLAEAMGHGVPIVAYGVAAIPETVGDAGLLLPDKSPILFATAVARVLDDPTLRQVLAAEGRARATSYDLAASTERTVSLIKAAIEAP
ncbi:MAG TPA: glycosyltransferase family 4 protein [Acidimicrobiales bacterium]|nr:glycosyltransferase family 4 protein [Acidimicrobiales bacterium]